ncbi:MAG: peptidoglycan DD-metalloendopeptidase family protein [Acidimicrobiales bacterium]
MRMRLMLAVVAVSLLLVTPVDAQTDMDRARRNVTEVTERLESFLEDLDATQRRGNEFAGRYWQVQSGLEKLDLEVEATLASAAMLEVEVADLRNQVKIIAVDQYMSQVDDLNVGSHGSEADRAASAALARLVVGIDNQAIDKLAAVGVKADRVSEELMAQREEQEATLAEVEATQQSIANELERLALLRQAVVVELVELKEALAVMERAEADRRGVEAEKERIAEERRRAQAAATAAAVLARQIPTPTPAPSPTVAVVAARLPDPTATVVPNSPLPDPTPTVTVANPQPNTPLPTGDGIVCPLAGPFTHVDDFNAPRSVGGVHRANDLISAQGTPVLAAASGTIEHRNSSVGGLSAHLRGDNGDYYFYTHLLGYENVGVGYVAAGTVIGYVGMTGNAPIPHLHFEIHSGGYGNYSNPYERVREACF